MSAPRSSEAAKVAAAWASSGTWPWPLPYRAVAWCAVVAAAALAGGARLAVAAAAVGALCAVVRAASVSSLAAMGLWERWDRTSVGPAAGLVATWVVARRLGWEVWPLRAAAGVVLVAAAVAVGRRLRAGSARRRVEAGSVVWARVRFEGRDADGATSKVRPVLVVRDTGSALEVLYMTSRGDRYDGRDGWVRVTGSWHRDPSWVDTTRRLRIPYRAVERDTGTLEGRQLRRVLEAARARSRVVQRR